MNAALEAGRVDAAFMVEPGYSGAVAAGGTALFNPYEETAPNLTVATYFATKQYIAENRDVVDRFMRAMEKSLEYAASNDGRGPRGRRRVHGDPARGDRQDAPADLAGRPQRADDPD